MTGSNRRPPACKAGALPAELILQVFAKRRPTLTGGSPQLPSALKSLTSVFGMGTGVTSLPSSLHYYGFQYTALSFVNFLRSFSHVLEYAPSITQSFPRLACVLKPLERSFFQNWINVSLSLCNKMWLSPRPISIRQLHASPHFHLEPIYLIVFQGSYLLA